MLETSLFDEKNQRIDMLETSFFDEIESKDRHMLETSFFFR